MRFLLVDDHAIVRHGLGRLIRDTFADSVVVEAATAPEALEQARAGGWDAIVLDLSLPGRGGLDLLKQIREHDEHARILVMTMHSEEEYAERAFRAGAAGYVTKESAAENLVQALRKVTAGGRYVSAELAERLAEGLGGPRAAHDALSDRELQVLRLLAAGLTVKQIGVELVLSEKTISTYRTRLLTKLRLETTADLIRYALVAGLAK